MWLNTTVPQRSTLLFRIRANSELDLLDGFERGYRYQICASDPDMDPRFEVREVLGCGLVAVCLWWLVAEARASREASAPNLDPFPSSHKTLRGGPRSNRVPPPYRGVRRAPC